MKPAFRRATRQSQEGSVAVEAAVCIAFILVPLISFVFMFGRFFWHYTVVQKAIHDATLYMAQAPLDEVKSHGAAALANYIIGKETADLDSGTRLEPWTACGYKVSPNSPYMVFGTCDRSAPLFAVQTNIIMTVPNPFYFAVNGSGSLQFVLTGTMRYAGK